VEDRYHRIAGYIARYLKRAPEAAQDSIIEEVKRQRAAEKITAIPTSLDSIPPPPARTKYDYIDISGRMIDLDEAGMKTTQIVQTVADEEGMPDPRTVYNVMLWSTKWDKPSRDMVWVKSILSALRLRRSK
jgi:hypothetical protein